MIEDIAGDRRRGVFYFHTRAERRQAVTDGEPVQDRAGTLCVLKHDDGPAVAAVDDGLLWARVALQDDGFAEEVNVLQIRARSHGHRIPVPGLSDRGLNSSEVRRHVNRRLRLRR